MSKFHHTKGYRLWRKRVFIRGKFRCSVTGSKVDLRAHHLYNVKDHPKYKKHVKKGRLCTNKVHSAFHNHFMGGYQVKCTLNDWDNFLKELQNNIDLFIKSDLL